MPSWVCTCVRNAMCRCQLQAGTCGGALGACTAASELKVKEAVAEQADAANRCC